MANQDMNYIRKLLAQKEKGNLTELDKEKVDNLKFILKDDNVFFELSLDVAAGILDFLGVPKDDIMDLYLKLISPENYQKLPKTYTVIGERFE